MADKTSEAGEVEEEGTKSSVAVEPAWPVEVQLVSVPEVGSPVLELKERASLAFPAWAYQLAKDLRTEDHGSRIPPGSSRRSNTAVD